VKPVTGHAVRWNEPHHASRRGIVELLGEWTSIFAAAGVSLAVYTPRSRLRDVMPVYRATLL
jgi:hypothetical protein